MVHNHRSELILRQPSASLIAPGGVIQRRDPCGDPGESDCAACVLRRGGAFGWANGKGQG